MYGCTIGKRTGVQVRLSILLVILPNPGISEMAFILYCYTLDAFNTLKTLTIYSSDQTVLKQSSTTGLHNYSKMSGKSNMHSLYKCHTFSKRIY